MSRSSAERIRHIAPWYRAEIKRAAASSGESNGRLAKRLGVRTALVRSVRDELARQRSER